MIWELDDQGRQAAVRHRQRREGRRQARSSPPTRTAKARRSPGTFWRRSTTSALSRTCPVERVTFNAITKDAVHDGDAQPARRSTRRWSTPISPAARSIISSASTSRRCCGASCPAPARPAACNRWPCASSATASSRSRPSGRANIGRSSPRWRRKDGGVFDARLVGADGQQDHPPRHRQGRGGRGLQARPEHAAFSVANDRGQARQAPPLPALHHLDPAAGSLAQARPCAGPHHAASRSASMRAWISAARRSASSPICVPTASTWRRRPIAGARRVIGKEYGDDYVPERAAQIHDQSQERAGGARGHPPDRHGPPAHARRALPRARAGQALRTDLDPHHREPDGIGRARAHHRRHRGDGRRRASSTCAPPARW